jgi:hypothetical protein
MAPAAGQSAKYGMPLYCVSFLTEELIVLGGGGGHGIPNRCALLTPLLAEDKSSSRARVRPARLAVVRYANNQLQPEPVCTFATGAEPPQRCVLAYCAPMCTLPVASSTARAQAESQLCWC